MFNPINRSRDWLVLATTAVIGLASTVGLWQWEARREQDQRVERFRIAALEHAAHIQNALDNVMLISIASAGLFNASENVTRHEFGVMKHALLRAHPEIIAVEWSPRVRGDARTAFATQAAVDGYTDFEFIEMDVPGAAGAMPIRKEYFPVHYLRPQTGERRSRGFDADTRTAIVRAMTQARDSGKPVASKALRLIQDTGQPLTIAVYQPIYRNRVPVHDTAARRDAIAGFVTVLFGLPALTEKALQAVPLVGLDWEILDPAAPQRLLHLHSARTRQTALSSMTEGELQAGLSLRVPLQLGASDWQMLIAPSAGFDAYFGERRAWFVLASGLVITSLALFYLYSRQREITLLKDAAYHDELTGLPNRKLLQDRLAHALKFSIRRNNLLAVLFLDIDGFKKINDTCGHAIGDKLLREVAFRLKCSLRESDTVARLGGDEFVVLAEGLPRESDAGILAAKIVHILAEPFDFGGPLLQVSVSVGISFYARDGQTADELLRYADVAMYQAKEAGRNRFRFYSDGLPPQAESASVE